MPHTFSAARRALLAKPGLGNAESPRSRVSIWFLASRTTLRLRPLCTRRLRTFDFIERKQLAGVTYELNLLQISGLAGAAELDEDITLMIAP